MANIPIRDIVLTGTPVASSYIVFDDGQMRKGLVSDMADGVRPVASLSEAQAGSDNAKTMTPLRVKDSIASQVGVTVASQTAVTAAAAAAAAAQTDIDTHEANTSNPHSVTKAQVGLGNADNTSDAGKPVSTAQAAADAAVAANAANASNLTGGTVPAARMPALTGDVTSSVGGVSTTINNNAVTNAKAAQMAAATLKGNPTASTANATDFTIQGLTARGAPDATNDKILIYDNAAGTFKYVTPGLIASSATAGVSSYNGRTGAVSATGTDVPLRNYLAGLALSTAGSSGTFGIAAGVATDSTNAAMIALASAYTKTTSAWAVGSGNGSLDTGTIAASTWYHVYLMQRPDTGVVDVLVSLSATAPTMPTNYTLKRRIGSMRTNASSQWTKFIQNGDTFHWDIQVGDISATNPGTAAVLRTLSTPLGVVVEAILTVLVSASVPSTDSPQAILISNPAIADSTPTVAISNFYVNSLATTTFGLGGTLRVFTNTSSQVRSRVAVSTAGTLFFINTQGWVDRRGKDS